MKKSAVKLAKKLANEKLEQEQKRKEEEKRIVDMREANKNYFLKIVREVIEQFNKVSKIRVVEQTKGWCPEWLIYKGW